jgi:molybdopterin molybdotransferase
MRPGKPVAFGRLRAGRSRRIVPVLGLPGNPVSSMITFEVFARPAIARISGHSRWERLRLWVILGEPLEKPAGLRLFARARLGPGTAHAPAVFRASLAGAQGSHVLSAVARCDAILVVPEQVRSLQAGSLVEAWWLGSEWGG